MVDRPQNITSMNYWYPHVSNLGLHIPRTEIILTRREPYAWLNYLDDRYLSDDDTETLFATARHLGYPLFMRNDLTSGKHNYLETCYVPDESSILSHLYAIVDDAGTKDQMMSSVVLREYIDLDWKFRAFRGLPIAPERRYFISKGKVSCHHAYWVKNAIKFYRGTDPADDWESILSEMNTESDDEILKLSGYAEKIATVLEGDWSLDFAKGRNGLWYFIDAAEADRSWHPDGCAIRKEQGVPKKYRSNNLDIEKIPLWYKI